MMTVSYKSVVTEGNVKPANILTKRSSLQAHTLDRLYISRVCIVIQSLSKFVSTTCVDALLPTAARPIIAAYGLTISASVYIHM